MNLRRTLFTVHMWIGLILGLLLAALGLSGSLLVYDDQIANLINPPPRAATTGQPLPLSSGKPKTLLANQCVVAIRQPHDEVMG